MSGVDKLSTIPAAKLSDRVGAAMRELFDVPLDEGIAHHVYLLRAGGIETYESCQGGEGHAFPDPTIRFYGQHSEGFRALAWAMEHGLRPAELRRFWAVNDGEPTGPQWEITFARKGFGEPR